MRSKGSKWQSVIINRGQLHDLGIFDAKEEAAVAYDTAARRYHGSDTRCNFDEQNTRINYDAIGQCQYKKITF